MLKKTVYIFLFLGLFLLWLGLSFTPEVKIYLTTEKKDIEYELFYAKPIPIVFSPSQTVHKKARENGNVKIVKFRLPFGTPCEMLRFDLGNLPGEVFTLHKIEVTAPGAFWKKCISPIDWKGVAVNSQVKILEKSENNLKLISTGVDPYLLFHFSEYSQFHISPSAILILFLLFLFVTPFIWKKQYASATEQCMRFVSRTYSTVSSMNVTKISPYWVLLAIFLFLCVAGITGSSIGLSRNSLVTEPVGERKLIGKYRSIRSDEFIAHGTASAVQSYKNDEQFSVINRNIGLSGRNFLFLHDTGAPVKHFAMLIRPANWLFFIAGLRQALAWYWWFPIFFGIFSILFLLNTLFKNPPWFHALIALGAVFCPYSAGWSFWPINCSAGAFLAAAALIRMFRSDNRWSAIGFALLAGWSFSVSAATLYFPHIWPCVSLAFLLILWEVVRQIREKKCFTSKNAAAFLIFICTTVVLLFSFFDAIREPVELAMKSAISGRIRHGGLFEVWETIRGWFFPITLYKHWHFNQSEDQSYQLILLPLLLCFAWQYKNVHNRALCFTLFAFICWALLYQFVGLSPVLTKITGWSRCTEPRVSYAIQIAQCLLLAELAQHFEIKDRNRHFVMVVYTSLAILFVAGISALLIPDSFWASASKLSSKSFTFNIFICTAVFAIINTALLADIKKGAVIFSMAVFTAGLFFNPFCLAPKDFRSNLVNEIRKIPNQKHNGRVLFSANSISSFHSQCFVMSGGKSLNSFFCYEDTVLFDLLFKNLPNHKALHRLNHLSVKIKPEGEDLTAVIPQGDCIQLCFNGKTFDFSKLPIDFIINLSYNGHGGLIENKTVEYCRDIGVWQLWKVIHH